MQEIDTEKRTVGRPKGVVAKGGKSSRQGANGKKYRVVVNGDLVADLRLALGWSQAELGKRCYLTQSQVSAIETREITPGFDAVYFLAKALKRPMEDFAVVIDESEG